MLCEISIRGVTPWLAAVNDIYLPLRNNPGWNLDRVKAAMDGDKDNYQVNLTTRIPVLIVYGTAAVNEENQIRFFDDIYGYDAELAKALTAGYPNAW